MPISVASPRRGLAAPIRSLVQASLGVEGRRAGDIGILLADDATLRELNRRWRGIDRATDVLSFEYGREGPAVAGDVVVSLDRMRVQARRYRVSEGRELARLLVHGTLHLAGLDHGTLRERVHMRRREAAALRSGAAAVRTLERRLAGRY